jgi:UDP-N-acetylglucosamine 1-carboxyvinyltransferase
VKELEKFLIEGGKRLRGNISISGAKNAAVALIPAAIIADEGICTIDNLPDINDVKVLTEIVREIGGSIGIIDNNTINRLHDL